jgi:hypothetical protein
VLEVGQHGDDRRHDFGRGNHVAVSAQDWGESTGSPWAGI